MSETVVPKDPMFFTGYDDLGRPDDELWIPLWNALQPIELIAPQDPERMQELKSCLDQMRLDFFSALGAPRSSLLPGSSSDDGGDSGTHS